MLSIFHPFNILMEVHGVTLFRSFFVKLCGGEIKPFIDHPTRHGQKLFLLFDFTHNLKNIFNNWINKSIMHLPSGFPDMVGEKYAAYFKRVEQLYSLEETKSLKVAFSLKKNSLNPNNIARTSPQHALSKCHRLLTICHCNKRHRYKSCYT